MEVTLDHVKAVGTVLTVAAAGVTFWRKCGRTMFKILRSLPAHYDLGQRLLDEVSKNAGKSLRDAVDRIETGMGQMHQQIEAIDARTAGMAAVQTAQIDGADHGIVIADLDGKLVKANRTFRRWVGKELAELKGDGWMQVISPDDLYPTRMGWAESTKRGIDYLPVAPLTYLDPEGQPFRARVTARIVREEGKAQFYWIEVWRLEP